ncbi:hypothetical protein BH24DEI2_BH24DEI2_20980 [soil metagenome]
MITLAQPKATHVKAKLFRGFSDPTRLTLLETLKQGEATVNEIVEATGFAQSNVSNHLACLKDCGLAVCDKRGRHVYYSLADPRIAEVLALSEAILSDVGQGVYACTRYEVEEQGA